MRILTALLLSFGLCLFSLGCDNKPQASQEHFAQDQLDALNKTKALEEEMMRKTQTHRDAIDQATE